jgi:hypothetical protein
VTSYHLKQKQREWERLYDLVQDSGSPGAAMALEALAKEIAELEDQEKENEHGMD